jgi:hypothetical protein
MSSTCGVMFWKAILAGRLKVRYSVSDLMTTRITASCTAVYAAASDLHNRRVDTK